MTERQAFTDSDLLLSVHEIRPVKAFCCFKPTIFFNVSGTAAAESSSSSESHLKATQKANSATDGAALRDKIINELLPSKRDVLRVLKLFEKNPRLGAAAPATLALRFYKKNMHFDMEHTRALALRIGMDDKEFAASLKRPPGFVAGSMLWLRPAALESLFTLNSQDFPDEIGLSDGTMAHAVERMLLPAIEKAKFSLLPLPSQRFSGYRGRPT